MKKLTTFILIITTLFCSAQSKKELNLKIQSLEKAQSELYSVVFTLREDVLVMKSELVSIKRENDYLKQLIASGNSNRTVQDTLKSKAVDNSSPPGRCKAITSKGSQCSRTAEVGSEYCWQHKSTYEPNSTKPAKSSGSSGGATGSGREIHTGPRGGKYYINSKGNKVYIKK